MPVVHIEPILDAALATLRAGVNAQVTAANAAATDGLVLDLFDLAGGDLAADSFYAGGHPTPPPRYPLIELAIPDWNETDHSLGQVVSDVRATLVLKVLAMIPRVDGTEILYRGLVRYVKAVLTVLRDPAAFGGIATIDRTRGVRGVYRFNPETEAREEVVGGALVVLSLEAVEVA